WLSAAKTATGGPTDSEHGGKKVITLADSAPSQPSITFERSAAGIKVAWEELHEGVRHVAFGELSGGELKRAGVIRGEQPFVVGDKTYFVDSQELQAKVVAPGLSAAKVAPATALAATSSPVGTVACFVKPEERSVTCGRHGDKLLEQRAFTQFEVALS